MSETLLYCGFMRDAANGLYCEERATHRVCFHWPITANTDRDGGATSVSRCAQHRKAQLPKGVIVTKTERIRAASPENWKP